MEKGEGSAQSAYGALRTVDPKIEDLIREEEHHEEALLELIDQKALQYTGSIVLGLNDALVELMGVLAGLTLALRDTTLVAVAGFITGVAASLSMAGSEYLSTKEEGTRSPLKASLYTGAAYVFAVVFLIFPYFLFDNPLVCLSVAVTSALMIILVFTFYIAVAKGLSFRRRFFEMAAISLGVAILNFCIGVLVRRYLHIEV
jgi:VIT1/CCC1 family predicted Fe2+/Mn2+ transporter